MPSSESDRALVKRIRQGDQDAWQECINQFEGRLLAFARSRLSDQSSAEDIVQETLIRAFGRLDDFQPQCDGAFMYYLRRILINVIRDQVRRLQRRPAPVVLDDEPVADRASPVDEAIGTELWEIYQRSVEELPEAQRQAVVLYVECRMDFDEVAEAMESPSPDAARMLVARGLKKLAEKMHVQRK